MQLQPPGHVPGAGQSRPVIGVGCSLGLFIRSVIFQEAGHTAGCRQQAGGPQSPVASRSKLRNPTSNLLPHSTRQSDGRPAPRRRSKATLRFVSEGPTATLHRGLRSAMGTICGLSFPPGSAFCICDERLCKFRKTSRHCIFKYCCFWLSEASFCIPTPTCRISHPELFPPPPRPPRVSLPFLCGL